MPTSLRGWDEYVRVAAEFSEDIAEDEELDSFVISPHFFPPPKNLPKRTPKNKLMSKFYIENRTHGRVYVPQHFIVRDHEMPARAYGDTWKLEAPHPSDVVVLAASNSAREREYGWYLRYSSCPLKLVRMTDSAIFDLFRQLETCEFLSRSSLRTTFIDALVITGFKIECFHRIAHASCDDFHSNALRMFKQYATSNALHGAHSHSKKRKRHAALMDIHKRSRSGMCTICLEDDMVLFDSRCCGQAGAMCDDCMRDLKCMCPICDRNIMNAHYQCTACAKVLSMRDYGFPCANCEECTLCKACYQSWVECGTCATARAASSKK